MCELQRLGNKPSGPSLGLIKPKKIRGLSITNEESTDWTEEEFSKLRQFSLFDNAPRRELEKIPFRFTYHYECEDSGCRGHKMKCTDWEMAALYRRLRFDYGEKWQDPFLDMYQTRMINDFDTHFYVGTVSGPWDTWIIIGVWRAPKTDQMLMF